MDSVSVEKDMSDEEYNLQLTDPVGYSWYVDGVREIFVKDESIELRWDYIEGKAVLREIYVF